MNPEGKDWRYRLTLKQADDDRVAQSHDKLSQRATAGRCIQSAEEILGSGRRQLLDTEALRTVKRGDWLQTGR